MKIINIDSLKKNITKKQRIGFWFLITALLLLFNSRTALFAQTPDTLWTKTFGGTSSDWGNSVRQTSDNGYIVAGITCSSGAGGVDVYLIRTNASGDTLWTKTFGGTNNDYGQSVQQTSDKGYIIAGVTESYGAGYGDVYLIKTDSLGDVLWTKTFGGSDWDQGNSVQQTSDDGYIITGVTESFGAGAYDVYLIKTNASGDTLWTKTFGGTNDDIGWSVQQTSDDGYIIAGVTESFGAGAYDIYLIKTDVLGNALWIKTFGGTSLDEGYSVQQTSDNGYVITGYTYSFGVDGDVYLIKTDTLGDMLWTKTYGGAKFDRGRSVQQTSDGGYIIAGETELSAGSCAPPPLFDIYVIKTNDSGDTLWTKTIGGAGFEWAHSVQQTSDQRYIITGMTDSYGAGGLDVYLICVGPEAGIEEATKIGIMPTLSLYAHPNPFSNRINIGYTIHDTGYRIEDFSLKIYDSSGRLVKDFSRITPYALRYTLSWDGTDSSNRKLASGVYFIQLEIGDYRETKNVILLK